jgi:hypothetical protein
MSETMLKVESQAPAADKRTETQRPERKPVWETPKLEDVSEQVMAQPYIRFT